MSSSLKKQKSNSLSFKDKKNKEQKFKNKTKVKKREKKSKIKNINKVLLSDEPQSCKTLIYWFLRKYILKILVVVYSLRTGA